MSKSKAAAKRWPVPPRTAAVLLVIAFLVVVSSALADEGAMMRRNTSNTPDMETEQAQLSVAQFFIPAQRANGTLVSDDLFDDENKDGIQDPEEEDLPGAIQYFAETDVPRDFKTNEDLLMDERTIAKPIVVTYNDEVEYDAYDADGIPDNTQAALPTALGGELAQAFEDAFDAEALASGGPPDASHHVDAFASVSFDDGETWSRINLSESALKSSFTLKDGTEFPGNVDTVKHALAGNKIVVVWTSLYARQGSPRYSLKAMDPATDEALEIDGETVPAEYLGLDGEPVKYEELGTEGNETYELALEEGGELEPVPLDIWGVAGAQKSIDYETYMLHGLFPFAEVGEAPYRTIWTARGVIQKIAVDEDGNGEIDLGDDGEPLYIWSVKWRKPERLTSGVRDAYYTAIDGAEGAGFGIVWQEDPDGLRPGAGEGPGEGWSGAVANHKTDMWYSFIRWDDFDKVENPLVDPWDDGDWDVYTGDPLDSDYLQTPDEVDAIGWDTTTFVRDGEDVTTNKPQVYERFSMPQRISDNNNVLVTATDMTEGVVTTGVTPSYTDDGKLTNIYAWLDRDGNEIPDMAAGGWTWTNSQGATITNAVTEDGRLLNGQTASTRCRMMMEGYDKYVDENADGIPDVDPDTGETLYERSAWVLLGYEETKGLGPGHPEETGDGQDEESIEPPDLGKNVKADTFEFDSPSYAKPGHIINAPDLTNPGYGEVVPYTGLIENDKGELQYATPIARRPSLFTNPIIKAEPVDEYGNTVLYDDDFDPATQPDYSSIADFVAKTKMQPGMTSAVMLYKEGTMRQGGPADIFLRRWVVPMTVEETDAEGDVAERAWDAHKDNPFALKNIVNDLPANYEEWLSGEVDSNGDGVIDESDESVPICPIWLKNDADGTYYDSGEIYEPESDGVLDGWDTAIFDGVAVGSETFGTTNAYPALEGYTSEYYPNGVMVRGAQNLSSAIPLDVRELEQGDGTGSAAETVPSWHLDLMPDLAAKVEDGTLTFTDCYSCHPDSWGVNPDDPDGLPVHGITERVWWWSQIGATATETVEESRLDVEEMVPDGVELSDDATARLDAAVAQGGTNYDVHWSNGFELSKGHRGYIDGNEIVMMFGYAPNWLISSHGKEPINLFIRRSFDGGATWSTTPATEEGSDLVGVPYDADTNDDGVLDVADGDDADTLPDEYQEYAASGVSLDGVPYNSVYTDAEPLIYSQIQGTGSEDSGKVFFYDETYAAGDFERMRNVSQFYSSSDTIIDPRYSPTNSRRQTSILRQLADDQTEYNLETGSFVWDKLLDPTDPGATIDGVTSPLGDDLRMAARPDDIRDPSKNFAVFESGDTGPVADGAEAAAENLYYSRATKWGDLWEDVVWYPSDNNPNGNEAVAWWDWLENASDDASGEAAVGSSPGGQLFYAVWNQWKENEDEHIWDSDAIFRRVYWLPDHLEPLIQTVTDVDELLPEEDEIVTLTASAIYTIGGEPVSEDQLENVEYAWDLDSNGSFETLGQTVTMKATGAMQKVLVRAADPTNGADDVTSVALHGAVNSPRVWNVKLVDNIGLAGTREALQANFRSPGKSWNHPAPADYDHSISAVIDWGDGTIEPGSIASKNDGQGSQRFVVGEHTYKRPGLYTVKVTVTDAYGNSGWDYLQYAVIVHRKAGALAMAGTFDDPGGLGEASIAANVKYKLKGKFPSGKVLFSLADMSFTSEKLDWMAISGRKGWVRGQGQLNGVGGYEFLLSVFDDRKNVNDLVRVKIWKANGKMATVIYDSQPGSPDDAVAVTPMKTGKIKLPLFKGKSWKYYFMKKK